MLLKGRKIQGPNVETIVIPRPDDEDIIFKAKAILDFEPFSKMCPEPIPPQVIKPGKGRIPNFSDDKYQKRILEYGEQRLAWLILESLKETPDLVWETVDLNDSSTWTNYKAELMDAGFSQVEIGRIIQGVMSANCLDDSKLEEAKKRFLATQEILNGEQSSRHIEQKFMQSGELVNGSN